MKKLFTLIPALLIFFLVEGQPKKPMEIEIFQQGGQQSSEFTSNRFSAINISSDGVVWAGTIYEGLYRYDTKSQDYKTWKKSTVASNLFINDIKADPLGGIWVAQSGNRSPGGSHIQGGINHIPDAKRDSVVFYSVSGTQTEGFFYSRNLVSLFISDSNRTYPTSPPESMIFAAQGLSRASGGGDIIRGGLNSHTIGVDFITKFDRIAGRSFTAIGSSSNEPSGWDWRRLSPTSQQQLSKPYAECIGGSSTSEMWVAVRDNYDQTEIVRYYPNGKPMGKEKSFNHTTPDCPLSQYSQPRAIKFDRYNNKWITTRNDGIIVLIGNRWADMKLRSKLPSGTVFNRNAIAEDKWGNMYFGTSAGLLVYYSEGYNVFSSGPDKEDSYDLFTTEDGLPGNNVTGLAFDAINGKLLMAIDGAGVAFVNIKPDNIEGAVYDVYTGIYNKETLGSTKLQRIPISNSVYIRLFEDGVLKEVVEPDNEGNFKFTNDEPDKKYRVEVEYTTKDNNSMKYIYPEIESQSKVPPVFFPDSLIKEIKFFADSLKKKCFKYKISVFPLFTRCHDGFVLKNYEDPFPQFYYPQVIDKDHEKKVDNLGIYLADLKTVYDLGGNATELVIQGMDNGWSMLKSLKSMMDLTKSLDIPKDAQGVVKSPELQSKLADAMLLIVKGSKEAFKRILNYIAAVSAPNSEIQPLVKLMTGSVMDAFDAAIDLFEKYKTFTGGVKERSDLYGMIMQGMDLIAKIVTTEAGGQFYKHMYAQGEHSNFIPLASAGSVQSKSVLNYGAASFNLIGSNPESLLSKGTESLDFYKGIVDNLNQAAGIADMASSASSLFQILIVVPGGQPVALAAKAFATSAKFLEIGAYAGALATDAVGARKQVDFSQTILNKSGINGLEASYRERKGIKDIRRDPPPPSQDQPVKLLTSKNSYNEKISAIQTLAGSSVFTSEEYANRLSELSLADSIYLNETNIAFEKLMASTDSAIIYIPDFKENLEYMRDSFVNRQSTYKLAFFLNQLTLLTDIKNKSEYFPALDSTANELKILNDSIYVNFVRLINSINENGIEAPAYLSQSDFVMDHNLEPGSPGIFTNTYTNYGTEAMRNVSFKISDPTEGFTITSADSIFVGNVAPGASVQISFNFNSPLQTDSITIGRYEIAVKADNGKFRNTTGTFMIIQRNALPVTLINFKVDCSGANSKLSWETTSESNSSHFEIEKSSNGIDWVIVRRVNTAGNSSIRRVYKLLDQSSVNSFYRLKHVDLDGKYTYSNVLRSKCGIERPMISVYPVPAKDVVNILAVATKSSVAKVLLLDITGREVRRLNAALQVGTNTIKLNISSLPSGQYILTVAGTEINKSMKITISK